MYYCDDCYTEIEDEDIKYNEKLDINFCPECNSRNVSYYNCEVYKDNKFCNIKDIGKE